ncbi:MAG: response regulator [Candidatus Omnitrophica bacterium]|nr:response regulator [Candidatus Omnitrophota bacterium]
MVKRAKRTILAIDDDSELLAALKDLLEAYDYSVITATSGAEGLLKIKSCIPNLILLDIAMPIMDGLDVLAELKANPDTLSIPVVMLTAIADTQTLWKAQEMGATNYIVKPFKEADLLKWVRTYES